MEKIVPFDHSYWIIPGKLLAGQYPKTQEQLDALLAVGIKTFINLTQADETNKDGSARFDYESKLDEQECKMYRHSVEDGAVFSKEIMDDIVDVIDLSLAQNKPVYFHCWGGSGRTGTVTGSYMKHSTMATKENVLGMIDYVKRTSAYKEKRSPGKEAQREFVLNYK